MVGFQSRFAQVSLFLLILCGQAQAGFDLRPVVGPAGPEVTTEYQRLFDARASVSGTELKAYKIIFIPGFSADYLDETVGYFRDARRELIRLGLKEGEDFEIILDQHGFSGERTIDDNAKAIAAILRESPKPVLAITHSKGAADLLEALIAYRDTRGKLRGWFSYQGANGGSILADVVTKGWTRPFMDGFLRTYGGSIDALEDLRQEVRIVYLAKNLPAIEEVMKQVTVVSLVTQQDYDKLSFRLRTVANLFDPEYRKSESDGMISIRNSMMPYSPFVFLTGVSHENTCETGNFDRARFTQASFRMLLDRIAQQSSKRLSSVCEPAGSDLLTSLASGPHKKCDSDADCRGFANHCFAHLCTQPGFGCDSDRDCPGFANHCFAHSCTVQKPLCNSDKDCHGFANHCFAGKCTNP